MTTFFAYPSSICVTSNSFHASFLALSTFSVCILPSPFCTSASHWILTHHSSLRKNSIFFRFLSCFHQNIIWVFPWISWGALFFFIGNWCFWVLTMGGCCSQEVAVRGKVESELDDRDYDYDRENDVSYQQNGAMVRLRGSSRFVSMYSQQGQKGVNQDSMIVWEVHDSPTIIFSILILVFLY